MKRYLIILFVAIMTFCSTSCDGSNDKDITSEVTGLTTIYDFETWDELSTCAFKYQFGRATVNKDKKYIKSGEGSMKVEIEGTTQAPYILFYPGFEPVNKSDFTDVDRIMIDVYNPENREISVWLSLDTRSTYGFEMNTTGKEFKLQPNQWNKVVYNLNRESLSKAFSLKEVMHIAMRFDTIGEYQPYTLYVDNIQIRTGEPMKEYTVTRAENELLFFENDSDVEFFNCTTYYFIKYLYPLLDVNLDPNYCSQGVKSMRARIPVSDQNVFPMLELQIDALGQDVFKDATAVSIDIYNANHEKLPLDIHFRDFYRTSGGDPKGHLKRQVWIDANSWITLTFTREELEKATVDMDNLKNIGFETIDQKDSAFGKYVEFYFDNFKIIK